MNNFTFSEDPMMPSYPIQVIVAHYQQSQDATDRHPWLPWYSIIGIALIGALIAILTGVSSFFVVGFTLDTFGNWIGTLLVLAGCAIVVLRWYNRYQDMNELLKLNRDHSLQVF